MYPVLGMSPPRAAEGRESKTREREIVRKGIERLEKQLGQLTQNILYTESVDISLVKKCKSVDVPCVPAAVGNIQKA